MGSIVLLIACTIVATYGEVYQLPPQGYLPPNHKYPEPYQQLTPTRTSHQENQQISDASNQEPFATMEIFKERNQRHLQPNYQIVPDNHKPIHVDVYQMPENNQQQNHHHHQGSQKHHQTAERVQEGNEAQTAATANREPDLESALSALDFFNEKSTPLRPVASISAPPSSDHYATGFSEEQGEIQGRPTRYYPVQQNKFTPLNDFYTPSFNQNSNQKKLEEIIDKPTFPKKLKPKKKYSSKLQKFPKKYKSNKLRVKPTISEIDEFSLNDGGFNNKLKISPVSKLPLTSHHQIKPVSEVEEFSMDSLKDKRRIPVRYSQEPTGEIGGGSSSFGAELNSYNSFPSHKGSSHADFSLPAGGSSGSSHADFSLPAGGSSDGERIQFEMHGMDGPDSYKFGYDTGKGHNRHFRYEERDHQGRVKGHYGFYDQEGKMSMMHYEADPHTGFHAGPYHHPENHHEYH